jgi:putative ABC transport system permease protein
MYYQAVQVSFDHGTNIHRIDVAVKKGFDPAAVKERIKAALGAGFEVDRPDRRNERVSKMILGLTAGLAMGSLIALLVSMFLVFNTMAISVVQRRKEISILRALGTTRRQVVALITLEGALVGVAGSALGVAVGLGLARGALDGVSRTVSEAYLEVATSTLDLDAGTLAGAFAIGVGAVIASSFVPALRAAKASPASALRAGSTSPPLPRSRALLRLDVPALLLVSGAAAILAAEPLSRRASGGFAASLALILGAALLAPRAVLATYYSFRSLAERALGMAGRMAAENLRRDLPRVTITTGALMVGVAMATSFGAFIGSYTSSIVAWVEQSVPADLFITSAARFGGLKNVPMVDAIGDDLRAIPGVALVDRVRFLDIDYKGEAVKLGSTDGDIYTRRGKPTYLEGKADEAAAGFRSGGAIVSENFAQKFDAHLGSRLSLATKTGEQEFPIVGVIVDYTSDLGLIWLDQPVLAKHWRDDRVDTYHIYMAPGGDLEKIRHTVYERFGDRYNLVVLTNQEFRGEIMSLLGQVFGIMRALELVAIVIAALGIVNALLASVLDRVRELGVLRAIGARRVEVRRMIMAEAGLIGVAGAVLGTGAGLGLGYILVAYLNVTQNGWHFPFRPPWGALGETAGVVVLVSVLAGWYPAREAAATPVHEALECE